MSRLLDNSEEIRNQLQARNLYTPENEYSINSNATIETLDRLSNVLSPFSGVDLSNTIIARQLEDPVTPLSKIALTMLGKQFAQTIKSQTLANTVGKVNVPNLLDGNPNTRFLERDFQITRRDRTTAVGKTFGLLDKIFGGSYEKNPFDKNSTNADFIKNTSKGQLDALLYNLNNNIYQPTSTQTINALSSQGYDIPSESAFANIKPNGFDFLNQEFYPFDRYHYDSVGIETANINLRNSKISQILSLSLESQKQYEYGSTQTFLETLEPKFNINDAEPNINDDSYNRYGLKNDTTDQIIWGRDGASNGYLANTKDLRNDEETITNSRFNDANQFPSNVSGGLLNYTKELLNAQGSKASFDLTRKQFEGTKKGEILYNGSPLTNNGQDSSRQHNVGDPYNRFAKAIRFNGNKIYENNSNENSVIYDSVMPRIHPTVNDDGVINSKNLFFSLENLAFEVVPNREDGVGTVQNDDYGTEIPLSEVGQNGGRLMWFAPYGITVNEQVVASHETTNFIGRGEPIYTYSNTERIANIDFKLIIDHPPQADGRSHKDIANFFAFGGGAERKTNFDVKDKVDRKNQLIRQRSEINPIKKQASIQVPQEEVSFYFPNDAPTRGFADVESIIAAEYELNENKSIDGGGFDLNEDFVGNFTNLLKKFTVDNENLREQSRIRIVGSSSGLFRGSQQEAIEYNRALTDRRINSMIEYIRNIHGQLPDSKGDLNDGYFVSTNIDVPTSELTSDPSTIPLEEEKRERRVTVIFERNPRFIPTIEESISPSDRDEIARLDAEIEALDTQIKTAKAKNILAANKFNPFREDEGYQEGFRGFGGGESEKKFMPAFRSQTPEDFHRRLTFLQQCMRQGAGVGKGDGLSAKNSAFGRQPVMVLRLGDFFYTKLIIKNLSIDYSDAPWDLNPEGMGAQFMMADISIQCNLIGGQSLKAPINVLQNAISWNYYGNSTFYGDGAYKTAREVEDEQFSFNESIKKRREDDTNGSETNDRPVNNDTPND